MTQLKETSQVEELVRQAVPGSKLRRMWPLEGGISTSMTAVSLVTSTGQEKKLILRCPAQLAIARKEFRLLQLTHSLGLATPVPYLLDEASQTLVLEYVAGEMTFTPLNVAEHVRQLAEQLAHIHSLNAAQADFSFLPPGECGCAELLGKRSFPATSALDTSRIREALAATGALSPNNPATLLHGDYWPGNTLWQERKLAAIIDWEDAAWGDPLIDLAKSRAEIVWIFGQQALTVFTQEYQRLISIDFSHLPYWDLCAVLRLVRLARGNFAELAAWFLPFNRADLTEQSISENIAFFTDQAFARLGV